jgi:hypothetical protein
MGKIRVHFQENGVASCKPPLKGGEIRHCKTLLSGAVQKVQPSRVFFNSLFDKPRRAVWGIVVNDKDMRGRRDVFKNGVNKRLYVFGFIVGWNADKYIVWIR